ncbi:MAG: hypothetical protein JW774_09030 [Candidatus Aureabacteria bacterium]|nr:hypothetical protein [Candidatus Auribacterota bacterium]
MKKTEKKAEKKEYTKPKIEKHKSIVKISGSGCSSYSSRSDGSLYYH